MPPMPEVQDVVRGVNVSIVDLIGALLPGLVWFILLATVVTMAKNASPPAAALPITAESPRAVTTPTPPAEATTPLQAITAILQYGQSNGNAFYAAVVLVAILLGWVIKASGLDLADKICALSICLFWRPREHPPDAPASNDKTPTTPVSRMEILRFPYNQIVEIEHPDALAKAKEFATDHLGQSWHKAPRKQPFESCKLVMGQLDPVCRDTAERAEAQVSLLGSLFLAALFSLALALAPLAFKLPWSWQWTAASALAAGFLGFSFHQDRRAEVDRTYLMALLVRRGIERDSTQLNARAAAAAQRLD